MPSSEVQLAHGGYKDQTFILWSWDATPFSEKVNSNSSGSSWFQWGGFGHEESARVPFGVASPGDLAASGILDHPVGIDEVNPNSCVLVEPLDGLKGVDYSVIPNLNHHIINPRGVEILATGPWQEGLGLGQLKGQRSGGSVWKVLLLMHGIYAPVSYSTQTEIAIFNLALK
jgi:hypothetical protein